MGALVPVTFLLMGACAVVLVACHLWLRLKTWREARSATFQWSDWVPDEARPATVRRFHFNINGYLSSGTGSTTGSALCVVGDDATVAFIHHGVLRREFEFAYHEDDPIFLWSHRGPVHYLEHRPKVRLNAAKRTIRLHCETLTRWGWSVQER